MAELKEIAGLGIHKGQYTKSVGYVLTATGSKRAATFYLGTDPVKALIEAEAKKAAWKALKDGGADVWPASTPQAPEAHPVAPKPVAEAVAQAPQPDPTPLPAPAVVSVANPVTVKEVREAYLTTVKQRQEGGQVSKGHLLTLTGRLERACGFLGDGKPLAALDETAVRKAVLAICKRPKYKPGKNAEARPMSADYAKACLKWLKYFLDWADEESYWTKPRRMNRIFKENKPVVSAQEVAAVLEGEGEADHFEIAELATLYRHASDTQRLWICLGLNCGFANGELSGFHTSEIKNLTGDKPHIARVRNKTLKTGGVGAHAKWGYLFPETVTLLRAHLKAKPAASDGLVFKTHHGLPLQAYYNEGEHRRDGVYQSWQWLYKKCGKDKAPRYLSPKFLRKTAAWLIRTMPEFGDSIADMLLSHADKGMIKHYSARDWDRLAEALKAVRTKLEPMFNPPKEKKAA